MKKAFKIRTKDNKLVPLDISELKYWLEDKTNTYGSKSIHNECEVQIVVEVLNQ